MDLLHWLLFGVLPALAVVLLGVGAGGPRLLALALAAAVCVPFGMEAGWPRWPWHLDLIHGDAGEWLWWCIAWAGVVGVAYDLKLLPKPVLLVGEVLVVVMLPWFVSVTLRGRWSFEQCVLGLGAAWTLITVTWWVLRTSAKVNPGVAVPLAGTMALIADAVLLRSWGGGLAWQLAGVAAVALGVSVATTIWRRPFVCGTGGTLCIVIVHVGALWLGRSERELLRLPFLMAACVPLPLWVSTTKLFADGRALGVVVGLAGSLGLAVGAVLG